MKIFLKKSVLHDTFHRKQDGGAIIRTLEVVKALACCLYSSTFVAVFYATTQRIRPFRPFRPFSRDAERSASRQPTPIPFLNFTQKRAPLRIRRLCWHLGQRPSRRILRVAA